LVLVSSLTNTASNLVIITAWLHGWELYIGVLNCLSILAASQRKYLVYVGQ